MRAPLSWASTNSARRPQTNAHLTLLPFELILGRTSRISARWDGLDSPPCADVASQSMARPPRVGSSVSASKTARTKGWLLGLIGRASNALQMITSAIAAWRSTGSIMYLPSWLSNLAGAHADLGQLDEAWRCIGEAMSTIETTKERWFEAEVNRIAGEIVLKAPTADAAKAEAYFERALAVARAQQAKSLELRAAMSMARLWRDQGKREEARDLLAPVYNWFTEGFDTLDLKEAKKLLDELSA
jgi:tetratricopeptide (TPR) repeat protein